MATHLSAEELGSYIDDSPWSRSKMLLEQERAFAARLVELEERSGLRRVKNAGDCDEMYGTQLVTFPQLVQAQLLAGSLDFFGGLVSSGSEEHLVKDEHGRVGPAGQEWYVVIHGADFLGATINMAMAARGTYAYDKRHEDKLLQGMIEPGVIPVHHFEDIRDNPKTHQGAHAIIVPKRSVELAQGGDPKDNPLLYARLASNELAREYLDSEIGNAQFIVSPNSFPRGENRGGWYLELITQEKDLSTAHWVKIGAQFITNQAVRIIGNKYSGSLDKVLGRYSLTEYEQYRIPENVYLQIPVRNSLEQYVTMYNQQRK